MKPICGLLLLAPTLLYAQATPTIGRRNRLICWQEQRKLTWRDFQAKGNPLSADSTTYEAVGAPELTASGYIDAAGKNNFLIRVAFDPQKAWVQDSTMSSVSLLQHEQVHFDICELVGRKLRVLIARAYKRGSDVFDPAFRPEIERLIASEAALHTAYDRDTAHSILEDEQKRWRAQISRELAKLIAYKSTDKTCSSQ